MRTNERKGMKKVVIINQPLNNRGDEAAHKALVRTLLRELPDAIIQVPYPSRVKKNIRPFIVQHERAEYIPVSFYKGILPMQRLITHRQWMWLTKIHPALRKYVQLMREADWVVNAPGGICMGGFQNWNHLMFLMMARHCKTRIAYYGRSIGPFPVATAENQLFRDLSYSLLKSFKFISLRDSKSETFAKEIGFDYFSTVDTAFLDFPQVDIPGEIREFIGDHPYMVMVPNLLIWHYFYKGRISKETVIDFFKRVASIIMEQYPELCIVMLPQTHDYGTYEGDDIHIFREISMAINDRRVKVIPDTCNSDIQQCIIRQARFVVGARYHSVVFAVNNNVPFVALSYEHKIAGMLETLGMAERFIDITHSLDNEDNIVSTLQIFKEKIMSQESPSEAQQKAKNISGNCMSRFVELVNNH